MDWYDTMSTQRRIEYLGFLYFNRSGEEDWVCFNSMYNSFEENEVEEIVNEVGEQQ
jgi:hypothetical protein